MRGHPRMRGEHAASRRCQALPAGSSPHARGAPAIALIYRFKLGVIPACAGSTIHKGITTLADGGHPRMRGEHVLFR